MRRRLDPTSPFDVLEASFQALSADPRPLVLDGADVRGLPDRPIPLEELRSRLLHPSTPYPVRDAAVNALLREAQANPGPAMLGLAGVLLPGLRRAAWPLAKAYPASATDIEAEVLTGLLVAVRDASPDRPRVAARLTWAARRAAEHLVRRERAERARPASTPTSAEPPRPNGHPDLVLARAIRQGVLRAEDGELIGGTRLGEYDLHAAAETAGVSYRAIRERRRRAEAALVAWLTADPDRFVASGLPEPGSARGGRPRQGRCPDRWSGVRQPTTTPRR